MQTRIWLELPFSYPVTEECEWDLAGLKAAVGQTDERCVDDGEVGVCVKGEGLAVVVE